MKVATGGRARFDLRLALSSRTTVKVTRLVVPCMLAAIIVGASCRESTGVEARFAPRECWYAADTGFARSIPAIVESSVIHATGSNTLVARDTATGARRWETSVTSGLIRGYEMVVGAGVVVVPLVARTVGVDVTTGTVLWTYTSPDDQGSPGNVFLATPAADSTHAYVPAWGASVSAIGLRTGVPRWIWRTPDTASTRAGTTGVAVAGDTVYAAVWKWLDATGTVTQQWIVAIDRVSGAELWREVYTVPILQVGVLNAPVVAGRVVVLHLWNGQVFAVDRFTRERLWGTTVPGTGTAVTDAPLVSGDTIFIPEPDRRVTARRITDGSLLWERSVAFGPGQLALAGTRLWVEAGPYLTALDRSSGRILWSGAIPEKPGVPSWLRSISSMRGTPGGRLFISAGGGTFCLRE